MAVDEVIPVHDTFPSSAVSLIEEAAPPERSTPVALQPSELPNTIHSVPSYNRLLSDSAGARGSRAASIRIAKAEMSAIMPKTELYRWLLRRRPHETGPSVVLPSGDGRHVLVTGGTGFIGKPLVNALCASGFHVTALTRNARRASRGLDPRVRLIGGYDQLDRARAIDLVINIAGASLNGGRWTVRRKQYLLASRVETTRALHAAIEKLSHRPGLLINGSAVGYYGPRDERPLDEQAEPVDSFSHTLCAQWEAEARRFATLGLRVCAARFGVVLGRHGGVLRELLRSYAFGAAATLGSGRQWLSWIHLDDLIAIIAMLIERDDIAGPVNVTAPNPVSYDELTRALRATVGAPIHVRVPPSALRLLLGEMADELLLRGPRVVPGRLIHEGYVFRYPELEGALRDLLG
jgi:uncharacterized protein